jgi:hypothetical protein
VTIGCNKKRLTWMAGCLACALSLSSGQSARATDSRLPDGTEYPPWEQPLQFSKTYYVDNGSAKADDNGPGSAEQPFRTINKAAQVLQPGERVVIAAGTYRECVRPARGGTDATHMISYEAAPGAKVFIKGSETLNDGWLPSTAAAGRGGGAAAGGAATSMYVWRHELTTAMFPDLYNPFALASVAADWAWLNTKAVDMGPYFRRRGLVFVDGMPLEPVEQSRELGNTALLPTIPAPPPATEPTGRGGLPPRTRTGAIMQEIGGRPDARLYVENPGNAIVIRVPAEAPAKPLIEITTREQVFVPAVSGLGYIRLKGLTFQHAANGYSPPQRGMVSTNSGNHWIIEGNTIEWANSIGLDVGNGFGGGGGGGQGSGLAHIIRGNTIRYCGVGGLQGPGARDMLVEDNLFEWCGWADAERLWESGAIKLHSARNFLFRRNVVRHIRHANGLWLDSGNSNCRITENVFADIVSVSAAIHLEMNRNYNQIDNNIIWYVRNAEPGTPGQRGAAGSGVFCHATDRVVIAQNLIGKCDNAGFFPVLRPERSGAGTGQENYIENNIFTACGKAGIVYLSDVNAADGNVYSNMPEKFLGFFSGDNKTYIDLAEWRQAHDWDKNGATSALQIDFDPDRLDLTITNLGTPSTTLPLFNRIDNDLFGKQTGTTRAPGPFADPANGTRHVDPRASAKK